jgi:hypothetical protein
VFEESGNGSMDWLGPAIVLVCTILYVMVVVRIARLAKDVCYGKHPSPPSSKRPSSSHHSSRSPLWKWAPWIVAVAGALLFITFVMMGAPIMDAIVYAGALLIFAVKGAATFYAVFRSDDSMPE